MAEKQPGQWYTVTDKVDGETVTITFRVRERDGGKVVDALTYVDQLAAGLFDLADGVYVERAFQSAYQAIEVEIWDAADATPPPEAEDDEHEDIVVDLWSPTHLALMLQRAEALQQLLRFHQEYALPAMEAFTRATVLPPPDDAIRGFVATPGPASGDSHGPNSLMQSVDELRLPRVRSGEQDDSAIGQGNLQDRSGSPLPMQSLDEGTARPQHCSPLEISQEPQPVCVPLLECQVRRELGNAVVLLGHYEAPVNAASVRRSQGRNAAAHVEELTGTPRSQALSGPLPPPPTSEEEATAVIRNRYINELELQVLNDSGTEYGLANVMNAMKPVLEHVVRCLKEDAVHGQPLKGGSAEDHRSATPPAKGTAALSVARFTLDTVRKHCSSFVDLLNRPVLLAESSMLYDVCHGDLEMLTEVLGVFQGSLTPILRGKKFSHLHGAHGGSVAPSPALYPINPSSSRASSNAPTPRNQSLSRYNNNSSNNGNSTTVGAANRHADPTTSPHAASAAVLAPPSTDSAEPFWLSCPPQEVQQLAFYAVWINHCEQHAERPGLARHRRAANTLTEYRTTVNSFRKMRESNFVPNSVIWSGHVFLITKLLSPDCTLENFLDVLGEGGYLPALSASGIPGAFVALLAAGTCAASCVADAAQLRLLTRKIETLLVELPNRQSTLRSFISARPDTHADRFEELWLGSTNFSGPKKFRTRVEMLYFGAVEVVLLAAERAWQQQDRKDSPDSLMFIAAADKLADPKKRSDAQMALQGFISIWRNFFSTARDKPPHRRSMSRSNITNCSFSGPNEVKLTPRTKPLGDPASPNLSATSAVTQSGPTTPIPTPALQPRASTPTNMQGNGNGNGGGNGALAAKEIVAETESQAEFTEAARKVCANLPMRLQHGRDPLPSIYVALYPGGGVDLDVSGTDAGAVPGTTGNPAPHGSGTGHSYADKPLPVSSLDNDFAYVQKCFGEDAAKESNEVKLKFYGLYKQATVGDINIPKPWLMDTVGRAKWDAWNKQKGMSLVDAKRMYVNEYKLMKEMRAESEKNKK